jgi:hypothetical protein
MEYAAVAIPGDEKEDEEEDDDVHWMCHSHIKKSISSQIIEKGTYLTLGAVLSPLAPMM